MELYKFMMKTMSEKRSIIAEALLKTSEANRRKIRNKMIIATKINRRLRELKMSQKVFAEKIGKPASEVSDILSGDRNLTIDTMTDIERVLNMRLLDTTLLDTCKMKKECTQNVTTTKHYKSYRYTIESVKLVAHDFDEYAECV